MKLADTFKATVKAHESELDTRFVLEIHGIDRSGRPVTPIHTELGHATVEAAPGVRWSPSEKAAWQQFARSAYIRCVFDNIYSLIENWDSSVPYNDNGCPVWITDYRLVIEKE